MHKLIFCITLLFFLKDQIENQTFPLILLADFLVIKLLLLSSILISMSMSASDVTEVSSLIEAWSAILAKWLVAYKAAANAVIGPATAADRTVAIIGSISLLDVRLDLENIMAKTKMDELCTITMSKISSP